MIDLAFEWAERYGFRLAAETFFPDYRAVGLTSDDRSYVRDRFNEVRRIALGQREFDLAASTTHDFVTRNEDCLYLSIDWPTEEGMRESFLGGVTDQIDLLNIWRRMIRELKVSMHKGAVVHGRLSAITSPLPAHRHTIGAHELAEQGVRMLAAAGGNEYRFDDLEHAVDRA
jgi:hypothetical protein